MGGLGGCKEYDLMDYPAEYRDIIELYIMDKIESVEAIYIAMKRKDI